MSLNAYCVIVPCHTNTQMSKTAWKLYTCIKAQSDQSAKPCERNFTSCEASSLDIPEQISVYTSSDRRGKSILIWGKIKRGNTYSRFHKFPKTRGKLWRWQYFLLSTAALINNVLEHRERRFHLNKVSNWIHLINN